MNASTHLLADRCLPLPRGRGAAAPSRTTIRQAFADRGADQRGLVDSLRMRSLKVSRLRITLMRLPRTSTSGILGREL